MAVPPAPQHIQASIADHGIDQLTRECLTMDEQAGLVLINRKVSEAIAASHWEDAVKWQRVLLRVRRTRARETNSRMT